MSARDLFFVQSRDTLILTVRRAFWGTGRFSGGTARTRRPYLRLEPEGHHRKRAPLWRIPAPLGPRASQLGIVLDPPHKEVLVATGEGNQIRVFSAELFDPVGSK